MSFVPCLSAFLTAALLTRAQGTVPDPVVTWTDQPNTQCGTATLVEEGGDEALQYSTEEEAKAKCVELGMSVCYGIYSMACAGDTFFLCNADIITEADDLDFSDTSCTQEMLVITGTATTTTNLAATTVAPTEVVSNGTNVTNTTVAPTVDEGGDEPDEVDLGGGGGAVMDPCDTTCSLLDGTDDLTCREQILGFAPPTEDTGSMPMLELTCEQKQAMVSGQGTCQDCAGCDVCLTTLAETGLWKISDGRKVKFAARGLKGTRWGFASKVAGIAMIAGIVVGAAVALRRSGLDLSRWELLHQQLSAE